MTSRERVYKAIRHKEPDQVPTAIGGTYLTGIHAGAYKKIVDNLGLDLMPAKIVDQFLMQVRTDPIIINWFNGDVINLENVIQTMGFTNQDWKVWKTHKNYDVLMPGEFAPYQDERGYTYINDKNGIQCAYMSPDGEYFESTIKTTMSDEIEYVDPLHFKASLPCYKDEHLKIMEKQAQFYHNHTSYSINGGFAWMSLFGTSGIAGHTFSDLLCLIALEPDYIKSIVMAKMEWQLEQLKIYLQAVGKYIDTIIISRADFGGQKSELFNPEQFKNIYLPAYKILNNYVHKSSKAKTIFHSCGSIRNILKYFIEAGVDIINPVQTSAGGMDPMELKQEFGDKLVFWGGGADTQKTLPFGKPEEVRDEVKKRISILAPGGGFVFSQIHNLQSDVPFENIKAMVEAVKEFGKYPIVL